MVGYGRSTGERELARRVRFGVRVGTEPYAPELEGSTAARRRLESKLGHQLPIAVWFMNWTAPWRQDAASELSALGDYDILLSWETPGVQMSDIAAGALDGHFKALLQAAAQFPGRVVIRLFHEPNGDWYDWAPAHPGGLTTGPDEFKRGWRHLVEVGRSVGAENIDFMFCANSEDRGPYRMEELYPGDAYVDLIGHDGYTQGQQSFDELHEPMYERLTRLNAGADYYIAECGINADATADWFERAYVSQRFPRLRAVCWFSVREFAIDRDPAAVAVHRANLHDMPRPR